MNAMPSLSCTNKQIIKNKFFLPWFLTLPVHSKTVTKSSLRPSLFSSPACEYHPIDWPQINQRCSSVTRPRCSSHDWNPSTALWNDKSSHTQVGPDNGPGLFVQSIPIRHFCGQKAVAWYLPAGVCKSLPVQNYPAEIHWRAPDGQPDEHHSPLVLLPTSVQPPAPGPFQSKNRNPIVPHFPVCQGCWRHLFRCGSACSSLRLIRILPIW